MDAEKLCVSLLRSESESEVISCLKKAVTMGRSFAWKIDGDMDKTLLDNR
jgi:hypothetical protein